VQFAVGHAAEFRDGLTILAPVIERAREVHVKPLSEGFICQQPPIGADLYLMTRIYVAARKTKTAKFSDHPCKACIAQRVFDADLPLFGQRIGRMTFRKAVRIGGANGVPQRKALLPPLLPPVLPLQGGVPLRMGSRPSLRRVGGAA
jgi:hypothetical protein